MPRSIPLSSKSLDIATAAVRERKAMQKVNELAALLDLLAARDIKNVLEIGSMDGGTLWAWDQISHGKLIGVDNFVLDGRLGYAPSNTIFVRGDSRSTKTRAMVREILGAERVDFLFIDGDHTLEAVIVDTLNWTPLVSDQGWVVFHDICHRWLPDHDMWGFWRHIENHKLHGRFEIFDPVEYWGGIGVASRLPERYAPHGVEFLPDFTVPVGILRPPFSALPPLCDRCGGSLEQGEDTVCAECTLWASRHSHHIHSQ